MGTRSDVALGMKVEFYLAVSEESRTTIQELFVSPNQISDRCILFYSEGAKWYHDCYTDLLKLYKDIYMISAADYDDEECVVLLVATPEYPGDTDADIYFWYDNPWDLFKSVSVCVEFNTE